LERLSFRKVSIGLTLFFTAFLFLAVATLFFVPSPSEVVRSLRSAELLFSLRLSLLTSVTATLLVVLFGVPIGYSLSRFEFRGKSAVKSIIDLPMAFPELVLGLALLLLFGSTPVGRAAADIGVQVAFTKLGIVVAQFFTALPFAVRVIYTTFEGISRRYELVARSLGYSELETFIRVVLPMARGGLFASTIIAFARSMGAFGAVLILAGGTYMRTETLPITLYLNLSYGNLGMAITSGIVLVLVSFAAILLFEWLEGGRKVAGS